MIRGGISLDKNQVQVEIARQQAIGKAGKKFIQLKLIDVTKNRIQGAMVLHAQAYEDPETRMTMYHFEERGGPLEFQLDEFQGGYFAKMLDVEHNRQFLASMIDAGFWEIEDKEVEKNIRERAEEFKKTVIQKPVPTEENLGDSMPDEVLDTELAKLNSIKAKRNLDKAKLQGKVQTHQVRPISERNTEPPAQAEGMVETDSAPEPTAPDETSTSAPTPEPENRGTHKKGTQKKKKSSMVDVE